MAAAQLRPAFVVIGELDHTLVKGVGRLLDPAEFTAEEEDALKIAAGDTKLDQNNKIIDEFITVRYKQEFILITGTPHDEIQFILKKLRINDAFSKIFGSPNEKKAVVKQLLNEREDIKQKSILIGDSITDCEAAKSNNIPFVYRIDSYDNSKLMSKSDYYLKNFSNLI